MANPITSGLLKNMLFAGSAWLRVHVEHVNALNVFPVPDGDTGTNMALTLQAALDRIQDQTIDHAGELARLASRGALMGARGNSGVILSQFLAGFSDAVQDKAELSIPEFAYAWQMAADRAYQAVLDPVEGTILTVAQAIASAALHLAETISRIEEFLSQILEAAQKTLHLTPELLPILKTAGVVDSGGQGLVYFLEGMVRHVKGLPVDIPADARVSPPDPVGAHHASFDQTLSPAAVDYGYDVQFLIRGRNLPLTTIRETINRMGDCPLVVGDESLIKVHVHVADPGVPLSYGVSQGTLLDIVVENMTEQAQTRAGTAAAEAVSSGTVAAICIAPAPKLGAIMENLGAGAVIEGGQTINPSTQEMLDTIKGLPAAEILLLPNNRNVILTAQQAAKLAEKPVAVVPTTTVPQGISALLAFDAAAKLDTNCQYMTLAARQVQTIEITQAVRDTEIDEVQVTQGAMIALLDQTLIACEPTADRAALTALTTIEPADYELLTIYHGQAVTPEAAEGLADQIVATYPHLAVEILDGGQPHYPYIMSLE